MEMPRKLTVSMLRVTVMMLRERVESVTLEMLLARDSWAGFLCFSRFCFRTLNSNQYDKPATVTDP